MSFLIGDRRGTIAEMNVVPLIDILLVLLVIFMMIHPQAQVGLPAEIPQPADKRVEKPPEVVAVEVLSDGSLRINQAPVSWEDLHGRLEEIFELRADRVAFVRGDGTLEFQVVARVIDVMRGTGIGSVGLLTPEPEKGL